MNLITRIIRKWYPGAIYHIMGRGNRQVSIFEDEQDYRFFLYLLKRYSKENSIQLHAFCLMTNHFHLLLETGENEIWKMMHPVMSTYARYYNTRYGYIGHLFQGRYYSCLVEKLNYFLQVGKYIHLNPVKAGISAKAENYEWSSYSAYLSLRKYTFLSKERTMNEFPKPSDYQKFVEAALPEGMEEEIMKAVRKNGCLAQECPQ